MSSKLTLLHWAATKRPSLHRPVIWLACSTHNKMIVSTSKYLSKMCYRWAFLSLAKEQQHQRLQKNVKFVTKIYAAKQSRCRSKSDGKNRAVSKSCGIVVSKRAFTCVSEIVGGSVSKRGVERKQKPRWELVLKWGGDAGKGGNSSVSKKKVYRRMSKEGQQHAWERSWDRAEHQS